MSKYVIKIWETEADRENGTPFEILNTPNSLEEAIEEAKNYTKNHEFVSIEVQNKEIKNTLYYKYKGVEKYFGEAIKFKPFDLKETLFYKYFKEQLEMIIASYDNPEEYGFDKITDKDLYKIVDDLLEDNYFNGIINNYLQQSLEEYIEHPNSQNEKNEEVL